MGCGLEAGLLTVAAPSSSAAGRHASAWQVGRKAYSPPLMIVYSSGRPWYCRSSAAGMPLVSVGVHGRGWKSTPVNRTPAPSGSRQSRTTFGK